MPSELPAPAEPSRPALFLSYARADRARAEQVARALENGGFTLWWDAKIEGGAQYARTIADALDQAGTVLVLWSAASIGSDWVRDEAAQGRDAGKLVPLSLDGSVPPLGFRQYQAIDLSRWRGKADAPEMEAVRRAVAGLGAHPAASAAIRPGRRGPSRRALLLGGAGLVIGGAGAVGWRQGLFGGGGAINRNSIAVLPFHNLSGNSEQAYFSDGLTEETRGALRRVASLQVVGATSSDTMRDSKDDAQTIASKLGVAYLLEGSVQRAGDTVRIALDLTDGGTGFSRWSNRFDRKMTDIFAVQTEIAQTVAQALSVQMATAAPAPGGTTNVAAYEHYLRGKALFNQAKDEPTDRAALAEYDLALASDPIFAMAHAARSRSLAAIANEYASADQLKPLFDAAIEAARRAIAVAPDLAEGQLAMGFALFTGRLDVAGARPFYDRASALGGGNADILLLFALYCSRAGRAGEAQGAITRAIALDPLNPRTHRAAGSIAYAARHYAAAIPPLQRGLQLNPELSNAHYLIGYCLMMLGRLKEARAEILAEAHSLFRLSGLAIVDRKLGDGAAAQKWFDQLVGEIGDSGLYQQAEVLAQWGEGQRALAALERAHAIGDSGLIYLATDPLLDPIRKNVEFTRLLNNLPLH